MRSMCDKVSVYFVVKILRIVKLICKSFFLIKKKLIIILTFYEEKKNGDLQI